MTQKGFSLIHTALLIVILGIIAGTGYFVWNSQKETKENLNNAEQSNQVETKITKKVQVDNTEIPSDWQWYENKELGFKFAYPKEWGDVKGGKENGNFLYLFSKKNFDIQIKSFPSTLCPQGDGLQLSTSQGWYEKDNQYYLKWCKSSLECQQDTQCVTSEYTVDSGGSSVEKINSSTLLHYDFDAPVFDGGGDTYSYVGGVINLSINDKYPGMSLYRSWRNDNKLINTDVVEEFRKVLKTFEITTN